MAGSQIDLPLIDTVRGFKQFQTAGNGLAVHRSVVTDFAIEIALPLSWNRIATSVVNVHKVSPDSMVDVDVTLASGNAQTARVIGNPQARVCSVLSTFEVGAERLRHDEHGAGCVSCASSTAARDSRGCVTAADVWA